VQILDRGQPELDDAIAVPVAQEGVQLVARDREQIGTKARVVTKCLAPPQAAEERRLDQLVGLIGTLGLEEPVQTIEVALEQQLAGDAVARAPALDQGAVRGVVVGWASEKYLRWCCGIFSIDWMQRPRGAPDYPGIAISGRGIPPGPGGRATRELRRAR